MGIFGPPDIEKLKAGKNVKGLIKALKDEDNDVRWRALVALGERGGERAVELLIKSLKDKDVREYATRALEEIAEGYTQIFYTIDFSNKWGEENVIILRKKCEKNVILLRKIGEPAIEPLIRVFKHRYHEGLMYAKKTIKEIGEPAIEPLIKALKYRDAWIRMESASMLGEIKDARAVKPLIQALLEDENKFVREHAARALGDIGDSRAVEPLIKALKDEDSVVRKAAKNALKEIKKEKS